MHERQKTRAPWHTFQIQLRAELIGMTEGNALGTQPVVETIQADGVKHEEGFFMFYLVEKTIEKGRKEHRIAWFNEDEVRWIRKEKKEGSDG